MPQTKIVFVTPSMQSFVKNDIQILSKYFLVKIVLQPWHQKKLAPINFISQFFSMLYHIWGSKFIVIHFGGYWAFWGIIFGKVFSKKTFIVTHGTDCASIPEINYGSLRIGLLKHVCEYTYSRATAILPVSESLIETELKFDPRISSKKQGLKFHFPGLKTPIKTIYNGLDEKFWVLPSGAARIKNSFIAVLSPSQFSLKGGDLILEISKHYPNCTFNFAGIHATDITYPVSKNVKFLGFLAPNDLRYWYQSCEFYLQLSSYEGFGCALCEAMLCGAIPIGSDTNHIPQIIGSAGFIIKEKSLENAMPIIDEAIFSCSKDSLAIDSRNQIVANYTLDRRELNLLNTLSHFTN